MLKMPLDDFCMELLNLQFVRNGGFAKAVRKERANLKQLNDNVICVRLRDVDPLLTKLDIYDYLEHITKSFEEDRCKIVLERMEKFYHDYPLCYLMLGIESFNIIALDRIGKHKIEDPAIQHVVEDMEEEYVYARQILLDKLGYSAPDNQTRGDKLRLPDGLNTNEARKYFARALERGYMKKTETGCKWLFGGDKGQSRLGYFCNKVFAPPRPINKLEQIFGVKKLSASISNAGIDAKRDDVKQWRKEMDENIFFD